MIVGGMTASGMGVVGMSCFAIAIIAIPFSCFYCCFAPCCLKGNPSNKPVPTVSGVPVPMTMGRVPNTEGTQGGGGLNTVSPTDVRVPINDVSYAGVGGSHTAPYAGVGGSHTAPYAGVELVHPTGAPTGILTLPTQPYGSHGLSGYPSVHPG